MSIILFGLKHNFYKIKGKETGELQACKLHSGENIALLAAVGLIPTSRRVF